MFRLSTFRQNPNDEVGRLIRATKAEMLTLVNEYHLTDAHGVTKTDFIVVYKNALAAIKLKLELAIAERERLKELASFEKETLQRKERKAELQLKLAEKQLELRERELEIQREHEKKQAASALDHRTKKLDLETTHHTRRQQAEAKLPVLKQAVLDAYLLSTETYRRKFRDYLKASATTYLEFANNKKRYFMKWLEAAKVSTFTDLVNLILVEEFLRRVPNPIRLYLADKEENDFKRCAKLADSYSLIHRVPADTPSSKTSWFSPEKVSTSNVNSSLYCNYCKDYGHTIEKCTNPHCKVCSENKPKSPPPKIHKSPKPVMNIFVSSTDLSISNRHLYSGTVSISRGNSEERFKLKILRDTAALQAILLKSAVPNITYTGKTVLTMDLTATTPYPLARVRLDCPFMQREVQVAIREKFFPMSGVQLLLGNDLAEDQQPANVIFKEDPQVCDSAVENPVLQLIEEVQSTVQ
ncbi:uncharacterized protein [Procambarus clarkii]|uniref:uncharacterized protein n=1 Tax=Procambarus clarkii TaxID=6728 RepID=UPI00374203FA